MSQLQGKGQVFLKRKRNNYMNKNVYWCGNDALAVHLVTHWFCLQKEFTTISSHGGCLHFLLSLQTLACQIMLIWSNPKLILLSLKISKVSGARHANSSSGNSFSGSISKWLHLSQLFTVGWTLTEYCF